MKVSELSLDRATDYLNAFSGEDDLLIMDLLSASISYVKSYTGLTLEEMDNYEDLTTAILIILSDFYENRYASVESNTKDNPILSCILNMHSRNLV